MLPLALWDQVLRGRSEQTLLDYLDGNLVLVISGFKRQSNLLFFWGAILWPLRVSTITGDFLLCSLKQMIHFSTATF